MLIAITNVAICDREDLSLTLFGRATGDGVGLLSLNCLEYAATRSDDHKRELLRMLCATFVHERERKDGHEELTSFSALDMLCVSRDDPDFSRKVIERLDDFGVVVIQSVISPDLAKKGARAAIRNILSPHTSFTTIRQPLYRKELPVMLTPLFTEVCMIHLL